MSITSHNWCLNILDTREKCPVCGETTTCLAVMVTQEGGLTTSLKEECPSCFKKRTGSSLSEVITLDYWDIV